MAKLNSGTRIYGNVTIDTFVTATGNVTGGNILTVGVISATGNIAGNFFIGNGSLLTGIAGGSSYGNANVVANLAALGSNPVSTTGNITGGNLLTGGLISATGSLTVANANADIGTSTANSTYNLGTGATVLGQTKNINIGTAGVASSNTIITIGTALGTGNVTFPANTTVVVANIGGLALSAVGNITGGNLRTAGLISATGNITGGNILGGANVNATTHTGTTVSVSANITGGNILTGGLISATGNITVGNVVGAANVNATTHTGTTVSVTGNITSGNLITGAGTGGNITGANVISSTTLSATGNITGGNLTTAGVLLVNTGNTAQAITNGAANGIGNIGSSTVYFNTVFAKATSAQYADLAEYYRADADYPPGTVLSFGGAQEVTMSIGINDARVAGIVSTQPAHVMNAGLTGQNTVAVALIGRVPTMVIGAVARGDMMVTAGGGQAKACATPVMGTVLGKALQDHPGGQGIIEIVVGRV